MKKCLTVLMLLFAGVWTTVAAEEPAAPPSAPEWTKTLAATNPANLKNKILNIKTGAWVSFPEMLKDLAGVSVVFVGETHDQIPHHQIQNKVLRGLYDQNNHLALGMEMFQRPYQKYLDDYVNNKISETEMIRKTEYGTRWKFSWWFYQPMVQFVHNNSLKVVALNVPEEISKKVAREGLAALTDEEKQMIPKEIDTANPLHNKFIQSIYGENPIMSKMIPFKSFYEAQCLWEDGMANSIAEYFNSLPDKKDARMVVLVGFGHIIYKFGIPERMAKRTNLSYRTIVCLETNGVKELSKEEFKNVAPADYVWFTEPLEPNHQRPLIGILLSQENGNGKKGLCITKVTPATPAARGNLAVDDVITAIDDTPVITCDDFEFILQTSKTGDEVKFAVLRNGQPQEIKIKL